MSDKNSNRGEMDALAAYEQRKAELAKHLFTELTGTTPGLAPIELKQLDLRRYGDGDG